MKSKIDASLPFLLPLLHGVQDYKTPIEQLFLGRASSDPSEYRAQLAANIRFMREAKLADIAVREDDNDDYYSITARGATIQIQKSSTLADSIYALLRNKDILGGDQTLYDAVVAEIKQHPEHALSLYNGARHTIIPMYGYNPTILDKFMYEISVMAEKQAIILPDNVIDENCPAETFTKARQVLIAIAYAEAKRAEFQRELDSLQRKIALVTAEADRTELTNFHESLQALVTTYFAANTLEQMSEATTLNTFIKDCHTLLAAQVGTGQWKLKIIAPLMSLVLSIGAALGIVAPETVAGHEAKRDYLATATRGLSGQFGLFAGRDRVTEAQLEQTVFPDLIASVSDVSDDADSSPYQPPHNSRIRADDSGDVSDDEPRTPRSGMPSQS